MNFCRKINLKTFAENMDLYQKQRNLAVFSYCLPTQLVLFQVYGLKTVAKMANTH